MLIRRRVKNVQQARQAVPPQGHFKCKKESSAADELYTP